MLKAGLLPSRQQEPLVRQYIKRKKNIFNNTAIGHFPIVYLVAKPSIWSEAEQVTLLWQRPVSSEHDNKVFYIWKVATLVS